MEVVAALIWDSGKFLICRRPPHKARGLLWEFAGGKIEAGESPEEALIRECREELGIGISVGNIYMDVYHKYPDISIHLRLYTAKIVEGTPQLLEHCELKWITPGDIEKYCFCPADETILAKLRNGFT